MRDLLDTATWVDDLSGLGPETGDPADGEEISVIGDALAQRTRYLLPRVNGALRMMDLAYASSTVLTGVAVSSTTYSTFRSLTTNVPVFTDDLIEVTTEWHVLMDSDSELQMTHSWDANPGGAPSIQDVAAYRRVALESPDKFEALPVSFTNIIPVTIGMTTLPATILSRARLDTVSGTIQIAGPMAMHLKVWRANGTV